MGVGFMHRSRTFVLSFLLTAIVGFGWMTIVPYGGGPDEAAHMVKAAASARGEFSGIVASDGSVGYQVPEVVANVHKRPCYALQDQRPASCPLVVSADRTVIGSTSAGSYNPFYYAIVGLPSLFLTGDAMLGGMRAMSLLWSALIFSWAMSIVQRWFGPRTALFIYLASTPLYFFLSAVVNPNSLEVASAVLLASSLSVVAMRRPEGRWLSEAMAAVAIGCILLSNTRSLGVLFAFVIAVVGFMFAGTDGIARLLSKRSGRIGIFVSVVGSVAGASFTVVSNALSGLIPGLNVGMSFSSALARMLLNKGEYFESMVAWLGWLDVPADPLVVYLWAFMFVGIVLCALSVVQERRVMFGFVLLLVSYALIPALVQAHEAKAIGIVWQGRYEMALFMAVVVMAVSIVAPDSIVGEWIARYFRILVVLVATAQGWTFVTYLHRMGVGQTGSWRLLLSGPDWQPWIGMGPAIAVSMGVAVVIVVGAMMLLRCTDSWKTVESTPDRFHGLDSATPAV